MKITSRVLSSCFWRNKVKKLTLAILLTVISTSAMAEWTLYNTDNDSKFYVNLASIRRVGHMAKMWDLTDYKTSQSNDNSKPYLSMASQIEYDCKEETFRFLAILNYSGNMRGGGVTDESTRKSLFYPIAPETTIEWRWKTACGKK